MTTKSKFYLDTTTRPARLAQVSMQICAIEDPGTAELLTCIKMIAAIRMDEGDTALSAMQAFFNNPLAHNCDQIKLIFAWVAYLAIGMPIDDCKLILMDIKLSDVDKTELFQTYFL